MKYGSLARMMSCVVCLAAMHVLASPPETRPLDLLDLGAPSFTTFSLRDGVPQSVIVSVKTDREGFVWLASAQGLSRYDGHRWSAPEGLTAKGNLGDLATDAEGTLWTSFRDRGVAHFDGSSWQFEKDFPTPHVRRLANVAGADGKSELWALTSDAGALVRRDGQWIHAPNYTQLPLWTISIARTHTLGGSDRLWIGTGDRGVWYLENGNWQRLHPAGFEASQIEDLLVTNEGGHEQLWVASFNEGIWRFDDDGMRAWTVANHEVPTNDFYALAATRDRQNDPVVWIASRDGLMRIHHDHLRVFNRSYGLPSNVIRGLSVWHSPDGVDVLWLATENGVARAIANGNPWQTVSLMGSAASGVFSMWVEPDGRGSERLWIGSSFDGLGVYDDDAWRAPIVQPPLPRTEVRIVKRIGKTLWVGLGDGHLMTVSDDFVPHDVDVPWPRVEGDAVDDIFERTVDGHLERWFALRASGLYRWRDGEWKAFAANAPTPQRMTKFAEQIDASGRAWLWATGRGFLARIDGDRLDTVGTDIGLPNALLMGANLTKDGDRQNLWIGSADHGIVRVDVTDPMHPNVVPNGLPPPPDMTAYSALRDSTGRVYICTNNGVQVLTPISDGYRSRVFTRRDGMVHDECNTNAQFIDSHDRFWTGMLGGATVFDPSLERVDRQPKPLKLTGVRIDGGNVANDPVRVPSGKHDVRIDYGLLSWQDEDESEFRTQLVGYETEPTAWTAQNFRSFNSLPPGDFTLRIEARDYAGNLSAPIELNLDVQPEWWQSAWGKLAMAIGAFLVAYGIFAWRTRALRARQRGLERVVSERTAALHEANSRLVELSYKDALTGLANRRRLLDALRTFASSSEKTVLSLIFVDVDFFKNYNDRFGHPAGDEALRSVGAALLAHAPPEALLARYGGEEFACFLPDTDIATARKLAEQFRVAVEKITVEVPGTDQSNRITISAGVACREIGSEADTHLLLRDADIALYQAKEAGRNCVRG